MGDDKKDRVPLQEFRGSVYRCKDCGSCFNTFDFACPVCALQKRVEKMVQLGVAAASMSADSPDEVEPEQENGDIADPEPRDEVVES